MVVETAKYTENCFCIVSEYWAWNQESTNWRHILKAAYGGDIAVCKIFDLSSNPFKDKKITLEDVKPCSLQKKTGSDSQCISHGP